MNPKSSTKSLQLPNTGSTARCHMSNRTNSISVSSNFFLKKGRELGTNRRRKILFEGRVTLRLLPYIVLKIDEGLTNRQVNPVMAGLTRTLAD